MRCLEGVDGAGLGDRLRLMPMPDTELGGLEAMNGAWGNISLARAVLNVLFCCSLWASVSIGVRLGVGGRGSVERLYVAERCESQSSRWGINLSPCSRLRGLRSGVPVLPALPVDHMLAAEDFGLIAFGLGSMMSKPSKRRPLPLTLGMGIRRTGSASPEGVPKPKP